MEARHRASPGLIAAGPAGSEETAPTDLLEIEAQIHLSGGFLADLPLVLTQEKRLSSGR
ncbi:hypothetical protein [Rhizobium halophytocola]|uniref:Uncharacterized protein n=1 Tax=Rhizobium halophytocola TaxID=735519 RepID=A0ABS4E3Y2_9HYPH|nr:hypothetical protein [Rhizobium halophytocola]MBP1852628.1 hypothetical protein [Rhizobium halophytocola]